MSKFLELQSLVLEHAKKLQQHQLFRVELPEDIFDIYLNCFDDVTVRNEHNCNCCRQFLRNYGNLVAVKDGKVLTLWDFEIDGIFNNVPLALKKLVHSGQISSAFVTKFNRVGVEHNFSSNTEGKQLKHSHFFFDVKGKNYVNDYVDSRIGELNTTKNMLRRALDELTLDSFETVLGLIETNSLYRGTEFKKGINDFANIKRLYNSLVSDNEKDLFVCEHIDFQASRIRNTAIGTLLIDLSDGRDLESAVNAYERVVAPSNYKRPTALVTQKMVDQAKNKVRELGLEDSLKRRYAKNTDISINNVLYVDRNKPGESDLFESVASDIPVDAKKLKINNEISIDTFLKDIVPTANSVELLLEDRLKNNFVTLIAPAVDDAKSLFAWDNNFSWSYAEGMADSMKQKVKNAGGTVDGELRISLEWFNFDDLDLHVIEPDGFKIHHSTKKSKVTGGQLDVDMNISPETRNAVENVIYPSKNKMLDGDYVVLVKNYTKRETVDVGFTIELEHEGNVRVYESNQSPNNQAHFEVVKFNYSKQNGVTIISSISGGVDNTKSNTVYNIGTNKFHKVNTVMLSPNYWTNTSGNKHFFFMLDGTKTDSPPRGIFNEFLKPELNEHRKVFEMLGNKIVVPESDEQLNGIGFSETIQNNAVVRVDGKLFKINFGV
jgi:hypothetical protein